MPPKLFLAILAGAAVAVVLVSSRPKAVDEVALQAEAAVLTKDFGASLLGILKGALETSGPEGAVDFCNKEAPTIAEGASKRSGWKIARTSLKPRNPASAPDEFERAVMTEFVARIAAGEPAVSLKRAEIVEHDGQRSFRYVQAIPTAELCLTCHGSELKPAVTAKIKQLYPADQATGFRAGDMRGIFTLRREL
ncbi:cytochrome c family protein [Rhodopseudomonas palustris BisB5]|uniref:Cytochrome c family protein n=1 Tax=Rhodopseudomonas palustris (strain BisB5) TaxID=316057 RepID=Q137Y1_RHOPS|nr:cytochrome c family protein [Rhodopseudomonas palustris BisB5]